MEKLVGKLEVALPVDLDERPRREALVVVAHSDPLRTKSMNAGAARGVWRSRGRTSVTGRCPGGSRLGTATAGPASWVSERGRIAAPKPRAASERSRNGSLLSRAR